MLYLVRVGAGGWRRFFGSLRRKNEAPIGARRNREDSDKRARDDSAHRQCEQVLVWGLYCKPGRAQSAPRGFVAPMAGDDLLRVHDHEAKFSENKKCGDRYARADTY
jgi:hypothetical protein